MERHVFVLPRLRPENPGMAVLFDYIATRCRPWAGPWRIAFEHELWQVHADWRRCLKVMEQRGFLEMSWKAPDSPLKS